MFLQRSHIENFHCLYVTDWTHANSSCRWLHGSRLRLRQFEWEYLEGYKNLPVYIWHTVPPVLLYEAWTWIVDTEGSPWRSLMSSNSGPWEELFQQWSLRRIVQLPYNVQITWYSPQSQRWLKLEDAGCLGTSHSATVAGRVLWGLISSTQGAWRDPFRWPRDTWM